jgi:hypothetical protein
MDARGPVLLGALFLSGPCAAIILTPIGFLRRSWIELTDAAGLSMVVVVIAIFSIAPIVFALTFLDLSAAVALRMRAGPGGWLLALLGAVLAWTSVVALPRLAPNVEPWIFLVAALPLAALVVAMVLLIVGRDDAAVP